MRILAIDPGTQCGWALLDADGKITHAGTWDLAPRRFEGGGMRYLRFEALLRETLDMSKPESVAFEQVRRHMGVDAAHIYGAITGVIMAECERRKIPYVGIHVQDVKKVATGKGNANKEAMIAAANARWGLQLGPRQENEADARWIAVTAARELGAAPAA